MHTFVYIDTYREQAEWRIKFFQFKRLCEKNICTYVAKYVDIFVKMYARFCIQISIFYEK